MSHPTFIPSSQDDGEPNVGGPCVPPTELTEMNASMEPICSPPVPYETVAAAALDCVVERGDPEGQERKSSF